MFQATQKIINEFQARGLKFDYDETDTDSYVEIRYKGDNLGTIRCILISRDNDNDVALRSFNVVTVPEGKQEKVLGVLNDLNKEYRYLKFILDDGDIDVAYDFPVDCDNVGAVAVELVRRFVSVIDDSYPEIMKAIWS